MLQRKWDLCQTLSSQGVYGEGTCHNFTGFCRMVALGSICPASLLKFYAVSTLDHAKLHSMTTQVNDKLQSALYLVLGLGGNILSTVGGTFSRLTELRTLGRESSSIVSPAGSRMPRTNSSPSSSDSTPASPPCAHNSAMSVTAATVESPNQALMCIRGDMLHTKSMLLSLRGRME